MATTPPDEEVVTVDWMAEAWRVTVADFLAYFTTARAILAAPQPFGRQWATGERRALNPFAFMATSAALLGAAQLLMFGLIGGGRLSSAVALVAPYVHFACIGLIAHVLLRLLGSKQRASASLGVALYVGGAPALAFTLFFYLITLALRVVTHLPTFDVAVVQLPRAAQLIVHASIRIGFAAVVYYFAAALVGAHRVRVWKGVLAILTAFLVTAVVYGFVRPPASTGAHLVLWLRSEPGIRAPRVGLRL
jgi:hypothetical protein